MTARRPTRRSSSTCASRRDELVDFARALVATPSPNPPGDERAVAALVEREAARARRHAGRDGRRERGAAEPARARRRRGGRTLILGGHLDTKPPGDLGEWRRDPYGAAVEDGELHGVGSGDMKGAVAAMVFALAALEAARPRAAAR